MEQQNLIDDMAKDLEDCYTHYWIDVMFDEYAKRMIEKGWRKERRGEWIRRENKSPTEIEAYCSICGRDAVYQVIGNKWQFENFCPHCGAKMKEATDDGNLH